MRDNYNVIVLFSGGVDSTACLHYYLAQKFNVTALFIDYGQSAIKRELKSVSAIARHYKISFDTIKIDMNRKFKEGEIKGRNAFFLMAALAKYNDFSGIISLGIHTGSSYFDTTKQFTIYMQNLFTEYTDGKIRLDAPFLDWSKPMVYEYCLENKVPINLTYSCELGKENPCGKCLSCLDRKALNVGAM